MCELLKLNESRTYYVIFSYIRSVCLKIDQFYKSKRQEKKEVCAKLYSFQILNTIRFFVGVATKIASEELSALLYPLIELISAYFKLSESPEFVPLKLHLLGFLLDIMECLNIYVPQTLDIILRLFSGSYFQRKIKKASGKIWADLDLGYKFSQEEIADSQVLN